MSVATSSSDPAILTPGVAVQITPEMAAGLTPEQQAVLQADAPEQAALLNAGYRQNGAASAPSVRQVGLTPGQDVVITNPQGARVTPATAVTPQTKTVVVQQPVEDGRSFFDELMDNSWFYNPSVWAVIVKAAIAIAVIGGIVYLIFRLAA